MESEICSDENASQAFPKLNSVSREQSGKSPLKPVNDGRRLGETPKFHGDGTPTKSSSPYTFIRQLDSAERWIERTSIVTKQDHAENIHNAANILGGLVEMLPIENQTNKWVSDAMKTGEQETKPTVNNKSLDVTVPGTSVSNSYSDLDELADLLCGLDIDSSLLSDGTKVKNDNGVGKTYEDTADNKDADDSWHSAIEDDDNVDGKNCLNKDLNSDTLSKGQSEVCARGVEIVENIDEDPFKPQIQITNSPTNKENLDQKETLAMKNEKDDDPLQCRSHQVDSLVTDNRKSDPGENCEEINMDPFASKSQLRNLPQDQKAATIVDKQETSIALPDNMPEVDPFKPKTQIANSPVTEKRACELSEKFDDMDNMVNSVVGHKEKIITEEDSESDVIAQTHLVTDDPFKSNGRSSDCSITQKENWESSEKFNDNMIDPFKPKSQILNSPTDGKEKHIVIDSELNSDQFRPKTQVINSPVIEDKASESGDNSIDPFKSNNQLINSPFGKEAESVKKAKDDFHDIALLGGTIDDPFSSNGLVANSPVIESKGLDSSERFNTTTDPFKPKNQIMNSPLESGSISDPFKSKSQLVNSPVTHSKNSEIIEKISSLKKGPFEDVCHIANSPLTESLDCQPVEGFDSLIHASNQSQLISSPFKTVSSAISSGNIKDSDIDPFKSKAQIANSPVQANESMCKDSNSVLDDADPFRPKTQLMNSPAHDDAKNDVRDPFASKCQLFNSPQANTANPENKSSLISDNIEISPDTQNEIQATAVNAKEKIIPGEGMIECAVEVMDQAIGSTVTTENLSHSSPIMPTEGDEEESSVKKNKNSQLSAVITHNDEASYSTTTEQNDGDFGESEEFIPATQVFNDPAFFEMLEKSNNNLSNSKQRGSLLLKFDPLQERRDTYFAKPASPGPIPIQKSTHVSDVYKDSKNNVSFVEDSICLFGTPPRVARRRTLTRKAHRGRAESIEEETAANEVDMIFGLGEDSNGMDTLLSDNLHPSKKAGVQLVEVGEMPAYTEGEMKEIRAQLTMHFQELMMRKDKDFQERLKKQEEVAAEEKAKMVTETESLKNKVKSLHGKLKSLGEVTKEYTDIIAQVSAEKELALTNKAEVVAKMEELSKYNSQVLEDNKTLEKSFDDLFHRYEKLKQALEKSEEKEKVLKQALETAQEKCKKSFETSRKMKEMAEIKLAEQDENYEKQKNSTKDEMMRLEAAVKRKDLQIQGLEATLEQKKKENKELTDLCDSLINKVSC